MGCWAGPAQQPAGGHVCWYGACARREVATAPDSHWPLSFVDAALSRGAHHTAGPLDQTRADAAALRAASIPQTHVEARDEAGEGDASVPSGL